MATEKLKILDSISNVDVVDGKLKVNITNNPNKGYFATEAALNTAFPSASNGDYAIVGSTDRVWVWDGDTSAWVDSGMGSLVTSVFGRIGDVVAVDNDYTVAQLDASAFTAGSVIFADGTDLTEDNSNFFWDNTNNRLGIGTASPAHAIDLVAPSLSQFRMRNTTSDAAIKNAYFRTGHYTNAEEDVLGVLVQSSSTKNILYLGGASSAANAMTDITFYTAADNTTLTGTQRMTINEDGEVGIGETNPVHLLDVDGDVEIGVNNGLLLYDSAAYSYIVAQNNPLRLETNRDADDIVFFPNNSEAMRIDGTNGYVGIGLSAPQELLAIAGNLVLPKASGNGIKVDNTTPTFPWQDLFGEVKLHGVGANEPSYNVYKGGIRAYEFNTVGDEVFVEFHLPHDYVEGSNIYIHSHWSVDTASVTGSVTWDFECTYAKGHDQAAFGGNVTAQASQTASTTAYQHMIAEVQLSDPSPSATELDTDDLETDGLILVRVELSASTLSGGNNPWLHFVDVHYQSTNIGTKQKAPPFYV